MSTTQSTKDEFSDWMLETLIASKDVIIAAKPTVTYDVDGNVALLQAKDTSYKAQFGKIAGMKKALRDQVKLVNSLRDDKYLASSSVADGVSGHMGKTDQLSIIIHQKRDSMVNIANRGKRVPKV
jgi:hypothetical protein